MTKHSQQTCHKKWMSKEYISGTVSVIIPTYNRAHCITETLDSIFEQIYRPIEVLVIDDGSTDNTEETVKNWQRKCVGDDNFKLYYFFQKNTGAPAARNLGLVKSRGEFVQYIDSDDLLAPSKISNQVSLLSKYKCNTAIYSKYRLFENSKNHTYAVYEQHPIINANNALKEWIGAKNALPPHSLLWRRKDIYYLGPWDETLSANQDGEFSMRFLLKGGILILCTSSWVYHRDYKGPSNNIKRKGNKEVFESRFRVVSRIENELSAKGSLHEYRDAFSIHYATLAKNYALFNKDLAKICMTNSQRLSSNGKIPNVLSYPLLSRLLGLSLKQRIGRFIRPVSGILTLIKSTKTRKPIASVKSAAEVYTFDECRQKSSVSKKDICLK